MKKKKAYVIFLHVLFSLLIVAGVTILYNNSHYGQGIKWLAQETYESTPGFTRQLKSDIDEIFNYVKYKKVFETSGRPDYSKPIVRVTEGPAGTKEYTIDEMIRQAKSLGYYLNEQFKVSGGYPENNNRHDMVRVDYRAYEPDFQASEPGDSYATMDQLSYEVLSHLGNYYSFYYRFIQNPSNLKFEILYQNTPEDFRLYTNVSGKTLEDFKAMGKYLSVTGEAVYMDSNLTSVPKQVSSQLEMTNPYNNGNYHMTVAVDTSYPYEDVYAKASVSYGHMRLLFIAGIIFLAAGLLGSGATLYGLFYLTGLESRDSSALRTGFSRLPAESSLLLFGFLCLCMLFFPLRILDKITHLFLASEQWYYGELVLKVLVYYGVGLAAALDLFKRYQAGALWKESLTCRVLTSISLYVKDHRFTTRILLFYLLFLIFNTFMALVFAFLLFTYHTVPSRVLMGAVFLLYLGLDFWVFHQLYQKAWETDLLNHALLSISQGDTTYKIQTEQFSGKEQELAEHINHISSGLETALHEKVQSERLKADLITNVSHDIKTPLTSIINYVDLIKREQIKDPKIQAYLEVLEQKSQRLKTLTEDLVEASKASSGNLKLEITSIDFVELIWQTNGEFEEKFASRHLQLVSELPAEPVLIEADGRYLWRVLENLYNNAFKYAMEHSRVYVDIAKEKETVSFTMKNVSQTPLNISADELTERFVRGDVARSTEGSGLGISIAKSLTELQGGEFKLFIDGDLFKAELAFPIMK